MNRTVIIIALVASISTAALTLLLVYGMCESNNDHIIGTGKEQNLTSELQFKINTAKHSCKDDQLPIFYPAKIDSLNKFVKPHWECETVTKNWQ